jgi:hypothetical protein
MGELLVLSDFGEALEAFKMVMLFAFSLVYTVSCHCTLDAYGIVDCQVGLGTRKGKTFGNGSWCGSASGRIFTVLLSSFSFLAVSNADCPS